MISGTAGRTLHHDLELLTNFGDTAVLLPLSIVFFIWLLATHRLGTALIWLSIVFACNLILGGLKVYLLSCPAGDMLRSPSGHTGFGILVYGSITLVVVKVARKRWLRSLIIVLGDGAHRRDRRLAPDPRQSQPDRDRGRWGDRGCLPGSIRRAVQARNQPAPPGPGAGGDRASCRAHLPRRARQG